MQTIEMKFTGIHEVDSEDRKAAINLFICALLQNGQLVGSGFPMSESNDEIKVFVSAADRSALSASHANKYVRASLTELKKLGIHFEMSELGHDPDSVAACRCRRRSKLALFTTYLETSPPIRCLDCFGVVPLYRLPAPNDDSYYDIRCWELDYQALDGLQMRCTNGERFATAQISTLTSSLSRQGRKLCATLSDLGNVPVYYYLYRGEGRSLKKERERRCPGCGNDWLLEKPLFSRFDMQCDQCHLLSNIAWNVRR